MLNIIGVGWMLRLLPLLPVCLCFAPRPAADDAADAPNAPELQLAAQTRPTPEQFAHLVKTDILEALAAGIRRYREDVTEFTCLMEKQERIKGRWLKPEKVYCAFREKPFSVLMRWREPGDSRALASLYVDGENNGEIVVLPKALSFVGKFTIARSPNHPEVRESSRYTVHEFGLGRGMERTYTAWKAAQQAGNLHVEYLGERAVPELGGRVCHIVHRRVDPPEEDGMTDLTLYIDRDNWLQTGSILMERDKPIGRYFFADIQFNPKLPTETFRPESLKK